MISSVSACQARCTGWAASGGARSQPSRRCLVAAASALPERELAVSRAQLVKGGLLAASGLLLSGVAPLQPAAATVEQVAAAAGQGAAVALTPAAAQNLSQASAG